MLTSLLQAAQAQQVVSKARDRERATTDQTQRFQDMLDLKAAGVEAVEAIHDLPADDSEHPEPEHETPDESKPREPKPDETEDDGPLLDIIV